MTRHGQPLTEFHLAKRVSSGISIEAEVPGQVPEYECREAAVFVGVTWRDWQNVLLGEERAYAVAHYRMHLMLDAHMNDAAWRQSENDRAMRASS